MHEGAIIRSLLEVAEKCRKSENLKQIQSIKVIVGKLHHIVNEILQMYFDLLRMEFPGFEKAVLEIEEREVRLQCKDCRKTVSPQEAMFICPNCCSIRTEVIEGDELYIESITGE